MNELKVGDRVRIISDPKFIEFTGKNSIIGMTGTVKDLDETCAGVEFDVYMGGHNERWKGKNGYCWYIPYERLEKIEETEEETKEEINEEIKAETIEQKILEVLRKEIAVEIGEEFDVYENGEKQLTCKFEENGFFYKIDNEFFKSKFWKNLVCDFHNYQFMIKPFIPKEQEDYWYFGTKDSNEKLLFLKVLKHSWQGRVFDYGMLSLGNVFRTEEDALKNEDKILKRMENLLKGESNNQLYRLSKGE